MYTDRIIQEATNRGLINLGSPVSITKELITESLTFGTANFGRDSNRRYSLKLSALSFIKYNKSIGEKSSCGFIYAIINPAWANYVKIGMSSDPKTRLANYQTYSPLRDYRLIHWSFWFNAREAEKMLHNSFPERLNEWVVLDRSVDEILSEFNKLSNKQF
ncbi:GIY-YIG nuclease family protein [Salmonella enterica]|nr:GIY-YIG nuclease family protein [Salmonella enterica]